MTSFVHPPLRSLRAALALAIGLLGLALPPAMAPALAEEPAYLRLSAQGGGQSRDVVVPLNKSLIVDLPQDAAEVIVSKPEIAAAVMRSRSRAVIQGASVGDTNIFFLDASGRAIAILDVSVESGGSNVETALQNTLDRLMPDSRITVESVVLTDANGQQTNRVVLTGSTRSPDDINTALAVAVQFAGGTENVSSVLSVEGSQQVMLKVTVAEVSREAVRQFGINLNASVSAGSFNTGIVSSQPLGGASNVITSSALSAGADIGAFSIDATLRALERRGAMRTLAEPVLTAMSGQEAEFLAGGEFPVPTGIEDGKIIFTFKEFGVKLKFTPTIRSNGVIGLVVDTSVSEPTTEGGFNAGGVTIPATKEREARTTVELQAGQTLAIGGLMQETMRQQINQFPGLGNIPILGALFRSRDYVRSETELVILVTPYLAQATHEVQQLPTDRFREATDAEAIFLGVMEHSYGVSGNAEIRGSFDGSVGFVLD